MIKNEKPSLTELKIIANDIRRNVIDICMQRGGYSGQGVALADISAVTYFDELRLDGKGWYHDRFVMSNGHDAIMTYGALEIQGGYSIEELRTINADGTKIEQSPLEGQLGFEITAGSLGQGPSQSAGIAWGERQKGSDKRVYCLFSDGELQEGNVWEGAMFAGHYKLDNLCYIIDNNDLQATRDTKSVMTVEPVPEKFEAFNIKARRINGNDIEEIKDAFDEARKTKGKPFAIVADTKIFWGIDSLHSRFPKAHYMNKNAADWDEAFKELAETKKQLLEELHKNSAGAS